MPSGQDAREWAAEGGLHGIGDSLYTPFSGPDADDGDDIDWDAHRALVRSYVGDLGHAMLWLTSGITEWWSLTMDGAAPPHRGRDRRGPGGRPGDGHPGLDAPLVHPLPGAPGLLHPLGRVVPLRRIGDRAADGRLPALAAAAGHPARGGRAGPAARSASLDDAIANGYVCGSDREASLARADEAPIPG